MTLELSGEDATLILEFVEGRLIELKKEIDRTENMRSARNEEDGTRPGAPHGSAVGSPSG